jgi:DNA-binding transcriptional LysR family regulator
VPFGHHVLLPLMPRFLELHPQVTVDVSLTDRVVDLMDERTDIAVRWGRLPSSDLVARRLGETGQAIVAAPAYLARYGTPHTPQELAAHNRLGTSYRRAVPDWPLAVDGRAVEMPIVGNMRVGDGSALRQLVLDGVGLGRLSLYHVQADIDAGRLVKVMEEFNPHEMEPIHAVYLGKAGRLPARVRAMLDFLMAHVKLAGAIGGAA